MATHIPLSMLSVWEISHRWHDVDPDESDPQKLPRSVRETLRRLLQTLTYGLLPYDVHGEQIPGEELLFTGIRKSKYGRTLELHLHQGIYDKGFLISVFIRREEFEKWCWRVNELLPAFWFPDQINQWGAVQNDDIPQNDMPQKDEPKTASAAAKKAAQKRHEPLNQLKQEFFDSYSRDKCKSRADAAGRFYKSLPPEKKKLLVESNAVRTLTEALGKHLKAINKQ